MMNFYDDYNDNNGVGDDDDNDGKNGDVQC